MKYIAPTLAFATAVAAHGFVDTALIGSQNYKFYQPYADPYANPKPQRISRPIQGNGPVENVLLSDLQCGGSSPAALHAEVAAGTEVKLYWTLWPDTHIGPTVTYMAKCPDTGCNDWMPGTEAVWFKIQEEGRNGDTWGATPTMKTGGFVTYTIPTCISSGNYLVRHEIIALHSAASYPGAQFYPGCHQLKVTGGGSTTPSGLVSFPGAYKSTDPGITHDVTKGQAYIVPGPAVFTC